MTREYRLAHLKEISATKRLYYKNNKDKIIAAVTAYYKNNKQKVDLYKQQWYLNNRDDILKRQKRNIISRRRQYQAIKAWYKTPRGRALHALEEHRRRVRKKGGFTFRVPGDFRAILETWKWRCAYCSKRKRNLTQDHMIPISWGGHDAAWNLVPACKSCNSRKGARVWLIAPPAQSVKG